MTIWTDLQTAIDAEIVSQGYTGTLEELGVNQPYEANLSQLLTLQAMLAEITATGGGGSGQIPAFTNSPVNFGAANAGVLKASAGAVYRLYCFNKNAAVRYFQIHNKATTPVDTDVPVESFPIAANTALVIDSVSWGANGRVCSTGVSWAFSSTETTLTLASAADQSSSVGYL